MWKCERRASLSEAVHYRVQRHKRASLVLASAIGLAIGRWTVYWAGQMVR